MVKLWYNLDSDSAVITDGDGSGLEMCSIDLSF